MTGLIRFCFFTVVTQITVCPLLYQYVGGNPKYENDITGRSLTHRWKRTVAVRYITSAILKGLDAVSSLMNGAKELEPRGLIRQFSKTGNYRSAVKDFEALNLFDVRNFNIPEVKGVGMRGRIGDRTFIVRSKGPSGRPTIEVMKTDLSTGFVKIKKTDILTYMD